MAHTFRQSLLEGIYGVFTAESDESSEKSLR